MLVATRAITRGGSTKARGATWAATSRVVRVNGRLVARGFSQRPGIDYVETVSPVVHLTSICSLLAFAIKKGMLIHQMDVATAFLNGQLEEEIYMEQPPGYVQVGKEHLACKLQRSVYGLKQSPHCWNTVLRDYLRKMGFSQSKADLVCSSAKCC